MQLLQSKVHIYQVKEILTDKIRQNNYIKLGPWLLEVFAFTDEKNKNVS